MMHHDPDHIWIAAKAIGVAVVASASTAGAVLVAQAENLIPVKAEGSIAAILATGVVGFLAAIIYIFRDQLTRAHALEMEKQKTEQMRIKEEAESERLKMEYEQQKSTERNNNAKTREDRLLESLKQSQQNNRDAQIELSKLRDRLLYIAERSEKIENNHQSVTDTATREQIEAARHKGS